MKLKVKKAKILMLEDSQSLAAIYSSYLCNVDYDILVVDTLSSAHDEWVRFQPDLVLLDVVLPDGSGLDLLKNRPVEKFPADVIVMTAYGYYGSALDASTLGAADFLSKPIDCDRLKVAVAYTLKNRHLRTGVEYHSSEGQGEGGDVSGGF
ncbi:MAG: two-component system repressor protein LuxO [Candidatus Azotimanducaceae bacterium]